MPQPAARVTDMHVCPMVTGIVPHVGGPIIPPCCPQVLIGFLPAARIDDHINDVNTLLLVIGKMISTNPADAEKNDVILSKVKTDLPSYLNNILLFDLAGIGPFGSGKPAVQAGDKCRTVVVTKRELTPVVVNENGKDVVHFELRPVTRHVKRSH